MSATSAGSQRPFFFQDQWACPCRVLGGHRSMSKPSRVFALTPPPFRCPSSVSALRSTHCQGHWISMHERKCTIFAEHKPNVNGKGDCIHWAYKACSVVWFKRTILIGLSTGSLCKSVILKMFPFFYIYTTLHTNLRCLLKMLWWQNFKENCKTLVQITNY